MFVERLGPDGKPKFCKVHVLTFDTRHGLFAYETDCVAGGHTAEIVISEAGGGATCEDCQGDTAEGGNARMGNDFTGYKPGTKRPFKVGAIKVSPQALILDQANAAVAAAQNDRISKLENGLAAILAAIGKIGAPAAAPVAAAPAFVMPSPAAVPTPAPAAVPVGK